ncbi:hypothetical protein NFA_51540 [Nocardia farcinica IFM 10152]|uniref:Uncharacterized protein n=1 Tax=Nocardia farcinica (strain IFM 10152) TaxID=247156 RepID=Q5YP85_NOCFA|nr:hypothetical protein NFA_51540 [Nocardia farcinica IFM 10152]
MDRVRGYPRWQEVSHVTYLLALIAVVAVAVLCWKAFGPGKPADPAPPPPRRRPVLGPDDDPDFLWRISRKQHPDTEGNPDR